jgi:hypothetical protein
VHEGPVKAFCPHRSDPPLRESVRPRSPDRRADHGDALGAEHLVEGTGIFPVAVVDEKAHSIRFFLARKNGVACLLGDPRRVRVRRDAGEVDAPGSSSMKNKT